MKHRFGRSGGGLVEIFHSVACYPCLSAKLVGCMRCYNFLAVAGLNQVNEDERWLCHPATCDRITGRNSRVTL